MNRAVEMFFEGGASFSPVADDATAIAATAAAAADDDDDGYVQTMFGSV